MEIDVALAEGRATSQLGYGMSMTANTQRWSMAILERRHPAWSNAGVERIVHPMGRKNVQDTGQGQKLAQGTIPREGVLKTSR